MTIKLTPPKHQDMITYEQPSIKVVQYKMKEHIEAYWVILDALEDKNMSVKEIHDLYLDEKKGKHEKTLKTIYRYIDKLEELELVVKSGQRMTEGKRTNEALYCKAARIIFIDDDPITPKWYDTEIGAEIGEHVAEILCAYMGKSNKNINLVKGLLPEFYRIVDGEMDSMIRQSLEDKKLEKALINASGKRVTKVTHFASFFATILKNPELFEKLRKDLVDS